MGYHRRRLSVLHRRSSGVQSRRPSPSSVSHLYFVCAVYRWVDSSPEDSFLECDRSRWGVELRGVQLQSFGPHFATLLPQVRKLVQLPDSTLHHVWEQWCRHTGPHASTL